MPDLRRSFRRIQRQYGHNIYLQRRLTTTNEMKFENKLTRYTVRNMHPSSVGLSRTLQEVKEGVLANVDVVYWFQWDANPRQGDRIREYGPQDPRAAPGKFVEFEIDYSHPMRGKSGRIEFWACGCTKVSETNEERGYG